MGLNMNTKIFKYFLLTVSCGLAMWIVAGLWHNLILPALYTYVEPHHEGIWVMLISYFILAFLMVYLFEIIQKKKHFLIEGLRIGVVVGVLWVFPHGLTMAAAHDTSIIYEVKNAIWHIVEQGIGGIVIALISSKVTNKF